MTCTYRFIVALISAITVMSPGAHAARTVAPAFMPLGDVADAPSGFVEMCARDAVLCMAGLGRWGQPIKHNPAVEAQPVAAAQIPTAAGADEFAFVKTINTQVNRAIRPMADYMTSGSNEVWSRPGRGDYLVGDCEDYAIEKRMRLIEAGIAPEKLFFSAAYVKGYGMHIVLVARLQAGDVVLDSLSPHVLAWSKVHYNWLRVQSTKDPLVWLRFGNPAAAGKLAVADAKGSQS